jgi:hypothetical protein
MRLRIMGNAGKTQCGIIRIMSATRIMEIVAAVMIIIMIMNKMTGALALIAG